MKVRKFALTDEHISPNRFLFCKSPPSLNVYEVLRPLFSFLAAMATLLLMISPVLGESGDWTPLPDGLAGVYCEYNCGGRSCAGCPEGSTCGTYVATGSDDRSYSCSDPDPAPEVSVMMLPVALGAAGVLAIRARRRAAGKTSDKSRLRNDIATDNESRV